MYFEGLLGTIFSFLTLVKAEWNTKDFQKREHSLVKPYQGSGFGVPNWDFQVSTNYSFFSCHFDFDIQQPINSFYAQGSTMVTSNYIRLTPDQRSKQGALWNKLPCKVSFEKARWGEKLMLEPILTLCVR